MDLRENDVCMPEIYSRRKGTDSTTFVRTLTWSLLSIADDKRLKMLCIKRLLTSRPSRLLGGFLVRLARGRRPLY
jgi:hypothetical protein